MRSMLVCGAVLCALLSVPSPAAADPPSERDADAAIRAADHAGRRLLSLLDQSRRARNVAQITCVDQRLSQVNSFGRMLTDRRRHLVTARDQGDAAEVAHLHRVLRTMVAQVRAIEREGRACVYPEVLDADRTVVTVTVDASIRHQDLSLPPVRR